jgi:predicted O-methyltransferase YrrM
LYSSFQLASKYLSFWLTASNGRGHGTHSPFVFDFIQNVLNDKRDFFPYFEIENLRKKLKKDQRVIQVDDFGAGSGVRSGQDRRVADIARHSAKSARFGQLLFRMVHYYRPSTIIELGTSLGLSGAYLASGNNAGKLITIEGAPGLAKIAKQQFDSLSLDNVELLQGPFDEVLPAVLLRQPVLDMVFIDGNHRKDPSLKYFNLIIQQMSDSSVIVFDDIHWSNEMEEAWSDIKRDSRVLLTVDLFFIGLVFFNNDFRTKQDFAIRF